MLTVAGAAGDEVFAVAEDLFGDLAALGTAPSVDAPRKRDGLSRVEVVRGETRRALLALPSPAATARDFVSLRLALTALCGGRSSRLQRLLVEEGRLCGSVSTALMETVLPGAATLALELLPGVEPERVEEIVLRELERSRSGLDRGDVERARQLLLSDWLFGHETVEQRGQTWGAGLALFGSDYVANQERWLAGATAEEVEDAAHRFLDPERGGVIGWAGV